MSTTRSIASFFGTTLLAAALAGGCGGNNTGNGGPDAPNGPGTPDANTNPDGPVSPAGYSTIPLQSGGGFFYTAPLTIGSQTFQVDVDTGSTTTGIATMGCASNCGGVSPLYSHAGGTDTHHTAQTQYADGSGWSGEVWSDSIGLTHGSPSVAVKFVGINSESSFFDNNGNAYQGILGLGPDPLLENYTTSYPTAAEAAGMTAIISFEMCSSRGTMWLGGFDDTKADPIQFVPMLPVNQNNPFYAVDLTDIALGGTSLGFGSSTYQQPIVDTGTSLEYLPTNAFNALVSKVNGNSGFKALFPNQSVSDPSNPPNYGCVKAGTGVTDAQVDAMLPSISYKFGSTTVTAPATKSYLQNFGGGMYCFGIANGGNQGSLLGDTFMQAFVTVFDVKNGQMGFGLDKGCSGATFRAEQVYVPGPREHGHPKFRPTQAL
jgi:hypothetical protein